MITSSCFSITFAIISQTLFFCIIILSTENMWRFTWFQYDFIFIERFTINIPKDFCSDRSIRACAPLRRVLWNVTTLLSVLATNSIYSLQRKKSALLHIKYFSYTQFDSMFNGMTEPLSNFQVLNKYHNNRIKYFSWLQIDHN